MNHHFRSCSEQLAPSSQLTAAGQNQNQPPAASRLTTNNNNQLAPAEPHRQDSFVRVYSDSQSSLDQLFNPNSTPASVPLRNRNLPASFFNPSWQQQQQQQQQNNSNNNNNHNANSNTPTSQQQPNLHARSVSLFHQPAATRQEAPPSAEPSTQTNGFYSNANANANANNNNNNNNVNNTNTSAQLSTMQPKSEPHPPNHHNNIHMRSRSTLAPMNGSLGTPGQQHSNNQQQANGFNATPDYFTQPAPQQQQPAQYPSQPLIGNLHARSVSLFQPTANHLHEQPVSNNSPANLSPMQPKIEPQQQHQQPHQHNHNGIHMRSRSSLAHMSSPIIQQPVNPNQTATFTNGSSYFPGQTLASPTLPAIDDVPSNMDHTNIAPSPNYFGADLYNFLDNEPIIQQVNSQPYVPYDPSLSTSSSSLNPTSSLTPASSTSSSNENNSLLGVPASIIDSNMPPNTTSSSTVDRKPWIQTEHHQNIYFGYH